MPLLPSGPASKLEFLCCKALDMAFEILLLSSAEGNEMRFKKKTIIVTGGSSGIGYGISRKFAQEGARVAIIARNDKRGMNAVRELQSSGYECAFYRADITEESQVKAAISLVVEQYGEVHTLVNNAGCGLINSTIESASSISERLNFYQSANFNSTYLVTAHCLPYLAKTSGSSVINISSTAAQHGNWGLYGVAKAGVEALTRSFAAEAAPFGVRVNCVSPGWIETSSEQAAKAQGTGSSDWTCPPSLLGRMGDPEEIAGAVCFFASSDASFITGQTLVVDGGMMITDYPSQSSLSTMGNRGFSQTQIKP
ncbi:MAG: SDR family NAD(P)-dependent oxidoreductase [Halopseudomonas aestusnigri]